MALRETRASWKRLMFFFLCIAVGVCAIVTLRSVIQDIRAAFGQEARSLVAADVLISTTSDWSSEVTRTIEQRLREFGAIASTESVETPTMARPADGRPVARMVELRAVQRGFPLYGSVGLQDGRAYSFALLQNHGALVRPELLVTFNLKIGDQITLGQAQFTIRGVLTSEPGRRIGGFSLGPRVLIAAEDLASTGLLGVGSRARHVLLVRAPEGRIQPLVRALQRDLRLQAVNVRSYRSNDDEVGRDFDRAENYLSLVGLVVVILGGIAVSSVMRVFVMQKLRAIAVLKCLGAGSRQIMSVYMLQVLALGLAGSLVGVVLARGAMAAMPLAFAGSPSSLLAGAQYGVSWRAAAQGLAVGLLVSVLFSAAPLMHVRNVKPSLLLRHEAAPPGRDWPRVAVIGLVSLALLAITAWQAGSWRVGLVVGAGLVGLAAVLQTAGRLLIRVIAPLGGSPSFPLRHAVLHLSRPGNQTRVILFAVGLGAFFVIGVRSLQGNLLREFSIQLSGDAPDMFLIDIQRGQVEGVRAFLADPRNGATSGQLIPTLRARVVGVEGRLTRLDSFDDVRARGSLAREFTVTYRDHLERNERVSEGTFWNSGSADPEVSIEQEIERRFAISVGDVVRFDLLGRTVSARVTSVREVDWKDSRSGGFMFVFRPGVLDGAPQTFISPVRGPVEPAGRARFQHDLVERFPNVSVIDFREILDTVQAIMSKVTLGISVVGGLVLFSGALILVGAVAMTKFQRVYEAAVFKTLGASTRTMVRMLLLEYGVLGSLAGLIGSVGAMVLTWGVCRYALEIPSQIFVLEHVGGVALTAGLVAGIGVLISLDVLRHKPLATLRAE
jgi:putative ABC transport system permease protein